jgi:hypothetical protein
LGRRRNRESFSTIIGRKKREKKKLMEKQKKEVNGKRKKEVNGGLKADSSRGPQFYGD